MLQKIIFNLFRVSVVALLVVAVWWNLNEALKEGLYNTPPDLTLEPGTKWDPKLVQVGQVWCKDYNNPFESKRRATIIVAIKDGWIKTLDPDYIKIWGTFKKAEHCSQASQLNTSNFGDWKYWKEWDLDG
ncbi:MAG: hypothetical protein H8D23_17670 [Candidatus Brocadiales bacterium]|nr:hypothetical protein [Candidatus Brocadiales bacterium]